MIVLARPNRAGNADRFYALEVAPNATALPASKPSAAGATP
jgi:hypothetical protein